MQINFYKVTYIAMLLLGTMITVTSNCWMSMWMGMEMNMMAFIPLLSEKNNMMSSEASLKYFLVQTMASSIFIMSSMSTIIMNNSIFQKMFYLTIISLMMKLGSAPFHFWFPSIIEGLSWMNSLILFTWQKIGPLCVLYYLIENSIINFFILMSLTLGALGGLNQTSNRKILTYSSINHIGWLMMSLKINTNLFAIYMTIYIIMMMFLTWTFSISNLNHLNQITLLIKNNLLTKMILFINFMSLGGLPPFLGFFPKWMIIHNMMHMSMFTFSIIMILLSLLTLFYYMKMMISTFLILSTQQNLNISLNNMNYFMMLFLSLMSLYSLVFFPFLILI